MLVYQKVQVGEIWCYFQGNTSISFTTFDGYTSLCSTWWFLKMEDSPKLSVLKRKLITGMIWGNHGEPRFFGNLHQNMMIFQIPIGGLRPGLHRCFFPTSQFLSIPQLGEKSTMPLQGLQTQLPEARLVTLIHGKYVLRSPALRFQNYVYICISMYIYIYIYI